MVRRCSTVGMYYLTFLISNYGDTFWFLKVEPDSQNRADIKEGMIECFYRRVTFLEFLY